MDAARFAAMSDPARNFHFSRGWDEPPPLKRERPGIAGTMHRAKNSGDGNTSDNTLAAQISQAASRLDREADAELFAGHHLRAEYLAQQAFALREDSR